MDVTDAVDASVDIVDTTPVKTETESIALCNWIRNWTIIKESYKQKCFRVQNHKYFAFYTSKDTLTFDASTGNWSLDALCLRWDALKTFTPRCKVQKMLGLEWIQNQ